MIARTAAPRHWTTFQCQFSPRRTYFSAIYPPPSSSSQSTLMSPPMPTQIKGYWKQPLSAQRLINARKNENTTCTQNVSRLDLGWISSYTILYEHNRQSLINHRHKYVDTNKATSNSSHCVAYLLGMLRQHYYTCPYFSTTCWPLLILCLFQYSHRFQKSLCCNFSL